MHWLLTLPRRWRNVIREQGLKGFLRYIATPPRGLTLTKAGWIFFGFMFTIVVFAYITGNNLLFLLFSAMLALMIVSGFMSEASLGKIKVTRHFPRELFAGQPFSINLSFSNHARRFGAYAFGVKDPVLFEKGREPFVIHLPPGGGERLRSRATLKKRGLIRMSPYKLHTQYPFLLFTKTRELKADEEILVYPAIRDVDLSLEDLFAGGETGVRERHGEGDAFSYLREYVDGEARKRIEWKKSARLDDLYVKEFDHPENLRVAVVFDPGKSPAYEYGLETAASLIVWLYKHGVPFSLAAGDWTSPDYSSSYRGLANALSVLALYNKPVYPSMTPDNAERIIMVNADGRYSIN